MTLQRERLIRDQTTETPRGYQSRKKPGPLKVKALKGKEANLGGKKSSKGQRSVFVGVLGGGGGWGGGGVGESSRLTRKKRVKKPFLQAVT